MFTMTVVEKGPKMSKKVVNGVQTSKAKVVATGLIQRLP